MQERGRWLLNQVLQTPELAQQFIHQDGGIWKHSRVNDYLDKMSLFMEKLLVLIHISAGQPARCNELLSLRYCNTEKGGHRCIFVENGLVVIVTYYDKGYNITGTEKIIHRYLPQEIGELLLLYIWLVLPMRQQLQLLVFNDTEIPSAFLWSMDRQKKWTMERMRKVMKRESDRLIGVPLNISSYRQIAIAISDCYMKKMNKFEKEDGEKGEDKDKDEDEQYDDAVAEQSAHTPETAGRIYARLMEEGSGHMRHIRHRYRQASIEWHEVLHFPSSLAGSEFHHSGLKRGWDEEQERGSLEPRFRRWQKLRQTNLQEALQQLMGPETQFRGKQLAALRAIMDNKSPIILVMRTGGGKSLMFMLPASVKEAGTTVVVTPLTALKYDMQRRCRELGINCMSWSARKKMGDTCILLVTPESAISQGFMGHLRKLQSMDRLDRIVIDECHIVLNTRLDFRRKLQKLGKVVEFTVQLVLLTATLPPSKEAELLSMMSIEAPLMFRDMTSRHNIAYSIRQCEVKDIDQAVIDLVTDRLQRYGTNSRIIVYGGQVEHCKVLAKKLGCDAYFAEVENKMVVLQDWIDCKSQAIVATNALGLGFDMPNVRLVLHAEPPFDLVSYGQESGRAGRDGKPSEAIVLMSADRIPSKFKTTDERLFWEYMTSVECRRVKLDQYFDGNFATVSCLEDQEACDNCRFSQTIREEELFEQDQQAEEAETEAEAEVDDNDMGMTAMAADLQEYKEQQEQRQNQQSRYRQSRIGAAVKVFDLEQTLSQLRGRCLYCHYYGMEDEHEFSGCREGQEDYNILLKVKRTIRYARYAACWGCGCPQWICKEFLSGGSRQCEYLDIVLAGAVVGLLDGREDGGFEVICKIAEQRFACGEEAVKWFGRMCGISGKQACNAVLIFLELYG